MKFDPGTHIVTHSVLFVNWRDDPPSDRNNDTKEGYKSGHHNLHYVEYDSGSSSCSHDGPSEVYGAELMWPPKAKS